MPLLYLRSRSNADFPVTSLMSRAASSQPSACLQASPSSCALGFDYRRIVVISSSSSTRCRFLLRFVRLHQLDLLLDMVKSNYLALNKIYQLAACLIHLLCYFNCHIIKSSCECDVLVDSFWYWLYLRFY